ncbi:MAG: aminoacyl--tRNA ligase-related protein [bacterium]|nr:aminoacyl--tRNA ligase-related protein [bacterium]
MLQTKLFTKTEKQAPKGEESKNAILLQRAGFVAKEMAGVYTFLPLGFLVLKKIEQIIREEMLKLGAFEIFMPSLTSESSWEKTKRADMDVLFHLDGRDKSKLVLNPTHEEVITPLMKKYISSYKDLPFSAFQFQNKFRNEPRAKSGILRTREFMMKDLYSFHQNENDLEGFYEKVKQAYFNIFERVGLKDQTVLTFASGGAFSKYSHEFQTVSEAGEDTIYLCDKCKIAINEEIIKEQTTCPQCGSSSLEVKKAVEVGNIFKLRTKFSESFDLKFKTKQGEDDLVEMGCYGIGLGRLMGVIAEEYSDERGLVWPKEVSPFKAHLLCLGGEKELVVANKLYKDLLAKNQEVLYDTRDVSSGEKFADVDLIGLPLRVILSQKTLSQDSVEVKERQSEKAKLVKIKDLPKVLEEF